jgi:hypothetical protein
LAFSNAEWRLRIAESKVKNGTANSGKIKAESACLRQGSGGQACLRYNSTFGGQAKLKQKP